jgi:hypothetical protein
MQAFREIPLLSIVFFPGKTATAQPAQENTLAGYISILSFQAGLVRSGLKPIVQGFI